MDGIVVKRYYGGGNGGDDRCRLTVLSPVDLSPKVACVNLSLPSFMYNKYVTCGSCCGLFSFVEFEGNIVLCNLTTGQLKRLPPPPKSKLRFKFFATGLGHDPKSDDFKVIRFLRQDWGYNRGYKERCELYSLKNGVWKDIPTPDARVSPRSGVYVGGRCYWTAKLGSSFGGSSRHYGSDILSFDFTTESFRCLHPPPSDGRGVAFDVVEYRGSLGAIGFSRSDDDTRGFGFEFWVREECSWTKVFDVVLFKVERLPLGLIDGRFLFLERKSSRKGRYNVFLYQLVVYDRITKEWKELDIYDYERQMEVCPYVEGRVALPDAMPMQRYEDDDDDSGDSCMSTDDEEENDDEVKVEVEDEDEDEDEENKDEDEYEEEKQINERRRERCDDWYDDDVDDSCEDEEDDDDTEHSGMSTDDYDDDEEENDDDDDDDDDDDYDEDEDKEADDR